MGLEDGRAEVDVLRSFESGWSGVPLVNEEGGSLSGVLVSSFAGLIFAVLGGDLVATESGPGLVVEGVTVG